MLLYSWFDKVKDTFCFQTKAEKTIINTDIFKNVVKKYRSNLQSRYDILISGKSEAHATASRRKARITTVCNINIHTIPERFN